MEYCSDCNLFYKKSFKSDYIKSVKHQEKLDGYYLKKFNLFVHI